MSLQMAAGLRWYKDFNAKQHLSATFGSAERERFAAQPHDTVERPWWPMEVEFPGGLACTERLRRLSIAWLRPQRFRALCQRSFSFEVLRSTALRVKAAWTTQHLKALQSRLSRENCCVVTESQKGNCWNEFYFYSIINRRSSKSLL